jgi:hypothetical protein
MQNVDLKIDGGGSIVKGFPESENEVSLVETTEDSSNRGTNLDRGSFESVADIRELSIGVGVGGNEVANDAFLDEGIDLSGGSNVGAEIIGEESAGIIEVA